MKVYAYEDEYKNKNEAMESIESSRVASGIWKRKSYITRVSDTIHCRSIVARWQATAYVVATAVMLCWFYSSPMWPWQCDHGTQGPMVTLWKNQIMANQCRDKNTQTDRQSFHKYIQINKYIMNLTVMRYSVGRPAWPILLFVPDNEGEVGR